MFPTALLALQLAASVRPAPPPDVASLVARARGARYQQDSTLASYEATVRQRISGTIGTARGLVGDIGRPRLAARLESVARIGWHRSLGAWGEIIAARGVAPIVGETEPGSAGEDVALVLPYYPGRERLWPVDEMREVMREARIDEWIRHPLEAGADSVYAYAAGDSMMFRLPDRSTLLLREIRVRPRRPDSRLVVGSLWVDVASGALVRAAYRPSMPMDLWPFFGEELDEDEQSKVRRLGPFLGTVREVIVEHGLYDGRFWLPRVRIANAEGTARIGRVTASIEQSFTYASVRGTPAGTPPEPPQDAGNRRYRREGWYRGQNRSASCRERGDTSGTWSADSILRDPELGYLFAEEVPVRVLMPCRRRDLLTSSELPPSIYGPTEELFTNTDLQALRRDVEGAMSMGSQPEWEPQRPTFAYGWRNGLLRYNRVEGLSAGGSIERVLGRGYTLGGLARIGTADVDPNAELWLARATAMRSLRVGAYRRLVAANDWGEPLGLGASINAALFARDDGFYYRATGVDVRGARLQDVEGLPVTWRIFVEQHESAPVRTQESVSAWISGTRFLPNIEARRDEYAGATVAIGFSRGMDPGGWRLSGAVRTEAALARAPLDGDGTHGRGMLDVRLGTGFGAGYQFSLTGAAGSSVGVLPVERAWFMGGAHTVRGHRAGALTGNSFWVGRAELGRGHPLIRPTLFADIGWAGDRNAWSRMGQPLSGAGIGAAMLDGLVRLDVARGLGEGGRWRGELYFEVR